MKREISGVTFVPFFVVLVYWGPPWAFFFFASAGIVIATREYFDMVSTIGVEGYPWLGLTLSFLLASCFYFDTKWLAEWIIIALVSCFTAWILFDKDVRLAIDQIGYTLLGVLWVAGTLSYLILIRNLEGGESLLSFVFLTVWSGDAAAYYGGRAYGERPLASAISPKKTVEGAVLGLSGSLAAGGLAHFWFIPKIFLTHCLIMGLFCGIIGQFGDLAESALKRHAGVKDSGNLIPGHGGVLDRVDGLMFAGPVFYFYYKWVVVG
tara:strand:+ start:12690 stop:13484 length:795 start_codon:yes stop_codon:yes gene_type:complete